MSKMVGVDVGGTFTDVISIEGEKIETRKVPTNKANTEKSVLEGTELVGVKDKEIFNHASTTGLNAILTRDIPKVAFLTTQGHRDILDMGRAWRPLEGQTDPNWRRSFGDVSKPLVPRYLRRGIAERIKSDGDVLIPFDEQQAYEQLEVLRKCNVQGVAICLINAYINPNHEIKLREMVHEVLGDIPCSISSETSPLIKEYPRSSTTVIDVLMKVIYNQYTDRLTDGLEKQGFEGDLNFADCAANLAPADFALDFPHKIIFSGPSAGTMASAHFGEQIGEKNILCCDVGGTSCDISLVEDGSPTVSVSFEIEHDLLVNTLTNEVTSIGAGGGSIVKIDKATGELRVGPESAGADPGPASYGRGGKNPTLTDIFLLIGVLNPEYPLGGNLKLDRDAAVKSVESLDTNLTFDQRVQYAYELGLDEIAQGIIDISVKHGIDPRDFSLNAYGSAGPMLLPVVMEKIGAKSVLVPPHPGLFSALGLLSSDLVYSDTRSEYTTLDENSAQTIETIYRDMEERLLSKLPEKSNEDVEILRSFDGHLAGQTWETPFVPVPNEEITGENIGTLISNFHETYKQQWDNSFEAMPVVGVTFRLQIVKDTDKVMYPELPERTTDELKPVDEVELKYIETNSKHAKLYKREELFQKDVVNGPAIINDSFSTIFVGESQSARVGQYGEIIITSTQNL